MEAYPGTIAVLSKEQEIIDQLKNLGRLNDVNFTFIGSVNNLNHFLKENTCPLVIIDLAGKDSQDAETLKQIKRESFGIEYILLADFTSIEHLKMAAQFCALTLSR